MRDVVLLGEESLIESIADLLLEEGIKDIIKDQKLSDSVGLMDSRCVIWARQFHDPDYFRQLHALKYTGKKVLLYTIERLNSEYADVSIKIPDPDMTFKLMEMCACLSR